MALGMLPELDAEGYLLDLDAWDESVAMELARGEGITLGPDHWALIELVRDFYQTYQVSPAMRVLVKHTRNRLGEEVGNSIYLMGLFPGNPAKVIAKIAGLPRPTNCL